MEATESNNQEIDPAFELEALKKIKNAWIAGVVSIAITIAFTFYSMYATEVLGFNAFAFIDVALMGVFTFGIYKKSRVCAVLMLLLFAANKALMAIEGNASGIIMALVFLWLYIQGVIGTFQYHKIKKTLSIA
ncbi:hypothetical protein [Vreelandella sulfidaeris]|uniref:hypothetical protein n=1 Tax=Vreelandella sulfidaeris TaxID=115553 RepID=UPI0035EEA4E6